MKILIGVGGRFHSNYMAEGLLEAGHSVELVTSLLPRNFSNIPPKKIKSLWIPEAIFRILRKTSPSLADKIKILLFGRLFARHSRKKKPDILISWSSFGKETIQNSQAKTKIVVRGSCHIDFQNKVLREEYEKLGFTFNSRSFVTEREKFEYQKADYLLVPSEFARKTFLERGFAPSKVKRIWLGADKKKFFPPPSFKKEGPLKVFYFGSISIRKGILYLLEATKNFSPSQLELVLVGDVDPEMKSILKRFHHFQWHRPVPQAELNQMMKAMHVYVLPSFEEGFAQALIQAMAAGLVPIATPNSGSSEMIQPGENGFIIPTRATEGIREYLEKLLNDKDLLESMRISASQVRQQRSWESYKKELSLWIDSLDLSYSQQKENQQVD